MEKEPNFEPTGKPKELQVGQKIKLNGSGIFEIIEIGPGTQIDLDLPVDYAPQENRVLEITTRQIINPDGEPVPNGTIKKFEVGSSDWAHAKVVN